MSRLMPGSSPIRRMLMSPEWAGARAGGQNLSALRQGNPQGPSAAQAYQQSVMNQALIRQREQEEQLRMQRLNPFFEYEQALEKGYIPEGTTLEQYNNMKFRRTGPTSVMQNFEQWKVLNPDASPEEQAAAFEGLARASRSVQLGGGGVGDYNPVTDELTTVVTPESATAAEGELSYVQKQQQEQAAQDAEFRRAAATLPDLESQLQDTIALRDEIQSGRFNDTGYFEGRVMRFTDEETAELAARQVLQTLRNLQITNLAPVTEAEIRLIEDLYASVLKDPEANIGALNAAIDMMQAKIDSIDSMGRYFIQNQNTLRDYGINQRWRQGDDDPDPEVEIEGL